MEIRLPELPISGALGQIQQALATHPNLILHAPPGAGKSTVVPLALLDAPWLEGKKIVMLEPRRLATKAIAERLASLLGEPLGGTVGYAIRFERRSSEKTRLLVVTEGVLGRMLQNDNALEEVGLVIFDEFHERNLQADLAMALSREAQQLLRPDLRLLLMSASMDFQALSALLEAPVLDVPGRMYPVEIHYIGDVVPELLPQAAAATALRAMQEQEGDLLIFLPGKAEIEACCAALHAEVNRQEVAIKPLYGMMNLAAQQQTLLPHPGGKRKIVVATSIAETSLTIEGVSIVIDGGRNRQAVYDGQSGLNRLVTIPVSLDAATQRTGRAGRLGPGHCYRLWSKASELRMQAFRQPEIETADLSALLLLLLDFGVQDPFSLPWLSPPPKKAIYQAWELLEAWEAVKGTRLTPHGRQLLAVPAPPRLAQLLLQAKRLGIGSLGVDLAALLEEKDPLPQLGSVDITLRLEAWYRLRSQKKPDGLRNFSKLEKVAQQYARHLGVKTNQKPPDPYQVGLLLAYAFPERIACQLPQRKGHFQLANGTLAQIPGHDDMAFQAWLAIGEVNPRERVGKVFSAAPLNPADLKDFLRESKRLQWNREEEKVQAHLVLRLGAIELKRTPTADYTDDEVWEVLLPELRKRGKALLNWDENVMQFILRLYFLRCQQGEKWPDLRPDTLLAGDLDWLRPYLTQVRDAKALQAIELEQVLLAWLPYEQQQVLDRLAPKSILVPTGAAIPLTYREDGEVPHLRVRLQEMFGQLETPTLLEGKLPLVLELLSPGFKPVQLTKDLRSFWAETYFEVRKELRQRYPKHAWPEDPLQAAPMRGAKPRPSK